MKQVDNRGVGLAPIAFQADCLGGVFRSAAKGKDGEAVVFPWERVTYSDMLERVDRYARSFLGLGVRPGDNVGLFMQECPDVVALLLALADIGAVAVPINNRYKSTELRSCISKADIKVLITSSDGYVDYSQRLQSALHGVSGSGCSPRVICFSGTAPADYLIREKFDAASELVASECLERARASSSGESPAFLIFTSGTSAQPKPAVISHAHILSIIRSIRDDLWLLRPDDVVWTPLPLCHVGGILFSLLALFGGLKFVHCGHFDPLVSLKQMEQEACTIALPAFDTIWLTIANHASFTDFDLSALRLLNVVGVPENLKKIQAASPKAVLVSSYGSTESILLLSTRPSDDADVRLETCGKPFSDVDVRVVNLATGDLCRAGEEGELQYRGRSVFCGYYRMPEQTKDSFTSDGWFCSGDLVRQDDAGNFVFRGRLKDLIKVGGENVSAAEIEDVLSGHSKVHLAVAVAAPDEYYGEVVALFVELKPGETATAEEFVEYCRGRLASFKAPRHVRFVTEWPISGTKVMKRKLREIIAADLISDADRLRG